MLKGFSLNKKLCLGMGTILLLVFVMSAIVFVNIGAIQARSVNYIQYEKFSKFLVEKEVDHLKWMKKLLTFLSGNEAELTVELDHTKCGLGKFLHGDDSKPLEAMDEDVKKILESMRDSHKQLHGSAGEINTTWKAGNKEEAIRIYRNNTELAVAATQEKLGKIREYLDQKSKLEEQSLQSTASSSKWVIGLVSCVIMGLGLIISILLIRGIVPPLKAIIQSMNSSSGQVSSASSEIARSSQQMAEGASEQASTLEETSSSLEEMSSMIVQNADNTRQASLLTGEVHGAARSSSDAMVRMNDAISRIKSSSDQTAKIVKTIDEIAFQTNLLALNAAVEAARAGDAGKGFAVVAEEVRSLAQRCAEAARNTAELIDGARVNADNGVSVSQEVATILEVIINGVEKVTNIIGEITAASEEQSKGIEQINIAVSQMNRVTQASAASSEESAAASEQLSAQAQELHSMVMVLNNLVYGDKEDDTTAVVNKQAEPSPVRKAATRTEKQAPRQQHKVSMDAKVSPDVVIPFDDDDFKGF